ncbi:class I SAM-dependent DNA methyltransferase [Acidovorax sp. BoFeN1]|uniref:class I SAM-dependent DNA methyltransferase n=1 Tax=Acidovorax sp. BoFeN1 TaxID=1231053 RepID=UPI000E08D49C|nr:DNA methyltransferase [Acidovorax sp. BoFeN1]RDD95250.1 class I SAM-dependent DNA methyltransferase [Acidovorax sp. BoFeN1]
MTPQDFIAKWGAPGGVPGPAYALNEEQGAQSHFLDLCELLGVPKPGSAADYRFEEKSAVIGGKTGYADVFMRGVFAWENKAPGKNLDTALKQLLTYSLALSNPPILVVSDRLSIRIHTQFTGHPSATHEVRIAEMDQPANLALLRRIWTAPESFKPRQTNRDITEAAAQSFAALAEGLRQRGSAPGEGATDPQHQQQRANQVAHFLTQCLFCFFAEDVGLLPGRMFERLLNNQQATPERLTQGLSQLFGTMQSGGLYGVDDIPWFNGGLFQTIAVPPLSAPDLAELRRAADLNWSAIDVSIFGTLFERGLDPAKRSQLGAHYTDPATIERLIGPVIRHPLLQKWELVAQQIQALAAKITKKGDKHYRAAHALFVTWLDELKNYRALDPACGSGNFLYLALKCLKDVEHHSHLQAAELGLDREADLVTGPHNVLGIELNEYAAELARVTVWIGELQWRLAHGYEFKTNPVLDTLEHIECRDALLDWGTAQTAQKQGAVQTPAPAPGAAQVSGSDHDFAQQNSCSDPETGTPPHPGPPGAAAAPQEATWPTANVVIGNPPFLGDKKMRAELGDAYTTLLRKTYEGRVPGGADLVCYWFDKARAQMAAGQLQRAGLVTTNSIRGGANRKVLDAICAQTRIFEAWSDEPWVNDGAAVRVSLVAFGDSQKEAVLDGATAAHIHADLTAASADGDSMDLPSAKPLLANKASCFVGTSKKASFDIPGDLARSWLALPNPHGQSNAEVVKPWINGSDLVKAPSDTWIVDFGVERPQAEAALFDAPFEYVQRVVKPEKDAVRSESERRKWWLHARTALDMRKALTGTERFMVTSIVAKHRVWVWRPTIVLASHAVCVVARADDTTFGILHSRFHELWALRMGTSLEDRPRYTPTTCFETFPFPAGLTPLDTAHQRTEAVDGGALIPANLPDTLPDALPAENLEQKQALAPVHQAPAAIKTIPIRQAATAIAQAAQRLSTLRQAWLNPPEWTQTVPEVVPLGMTTSPYPNRTVPKPGFEKDLAKRTLTNLYNLRPAWLAAAHAQLDAAVAAAYGWGDYTADMPDDEILRRLLALNLERSAQPSA